MSETENLKDDISWRLKTTWNSANQYSFTGTCQVCTQHTAWGLLPACVTELLDTEEIMRPVEPWVCTAQDKVVPSPLRGFHTRGWDGGLVSEVLMRQTWGTKCDPSFTHIRGWCTALPCDCSPEAMKTGESRGLPGQRVSFSFNWKTKLGLERWLSH